MDVRALPRREMLVERLARTGRVISVGQYMLVSIAACLVLALIFYVFVRLPMVPSLLAGAAIGFAAPPKLAGQPDAVDAA